MNHYRMAVLLSQGEDGWIVAEAPEVHAVSQGRTTDEALTNIREAIELALEDERPSSTLMLLDVAA